MIQYGRPAMWRRRRHTATRAFLVLAMVLASLWAGELVSSAAGSSADLLAASHSLPGVEPAAPPDRVPALRPPVQRSTQSGRLVPVLLGMLAAAFTVVHGVGAGRLRSGLAAARSLVQLTQLEEPAMIPSTHHPKAGSGAAGMPRRPSGHEQGAGHEHATG
jgi:hypothetical protein